MASSIDILNIPSNKKTVYTWTINKFSSLSNFNRSDDFLTYKELTVDLVLNLNQNAFHDRMKNHCSINLLVRTLLNDEFNVYCQISLLNQNGEKCNTKEGFVKIVNSVIESNWQYTISRDYLKANGFLIGDKLKIYCEVHVLDNPIMSLANKVEFTQNKLSTITHDLQQLLESRKYSDVILVAGKKQFTAHKVILSSRSPVFAAMFEHECEEKKQNRVEITDVDPETLEELLRYIYTDKCSSLDQYSADLMVAADKYQMDSLKTICEESLSMNLTVDSAVKLFLLSDMHSAAKLKVNCSNYITDHCTEVSLEQWKALITAPEHELSFSLFQSVSNRKIS